MMSNDLHRLWNEPAVRRYLWDNELVPIERVESIIEHSLASFTARGFGLWAALPQPVDELIGFSGFWHFHEPPKLELIFGIAPAHWNLGLATETAKRC
jgi:ribosomal-protein-alanine N-acetyltransferase